MVEGSAIADGDFERRSNVAVEPNKDPVLANGVQAQEYTAELACTHLRKIRLVASLRGGGCMNDHLRIGEHSNGGAESRDAVGRGTIEVRRILAEKRRQKSNANAARRDENLRLVDPQHRARATKCPLGA